MNLSGLLFGLCAALALLGGAGAAFLRGTRPAVLALAAAMVGVAGMCLALGADFVAVTVALVLGAAVPAAALVAAQVAPPPAPDVREGAGRQAGVAVLVVAGFGLLAWVTTRTTWPPAAGRRETAASWLGWRLLTDHLPVLGITSLLLAAAALLAVSLLRTRAPRHDPRQPPVAS